MVRHSGVMTAAEVSDYAHRASALLRPAELGGKGMADRQEVAEPALVESHALRRGAEIR